MQSPLDSSTGLVMAGAAALLMAAAQAFKTVKTSRNGNGSHIGNTDDAVWRASMLDLSQRQMAVLEKTSGAMAIMAINLVHMAETEKETLSVANKTYSLLERRVVVRREGEPI